MKIKDILAIVAVAVMTGGCSSDEGMQQGGRVPIRLSASLEGGSAVWAGSSTTRAATTSTTQDTELLDGQTVAAYIKEKGGDWIANPLACTVSGNAGNLTYSGNCYYPMDATPVTIYAVHPSSATSGNAFTVNADQTQEDSYAASDLCYCKSADKNRQEAAHTLTFSHVMSKIIVNVDVSGVGITPAQAETAVTNLKLKAKTQATITYPTGSDPDYSLSEASTPGYIAMNVGGAAIIPPQTINADGDVRITFDVAGIGPIAYDFPANTELAPNTEYTYTVNVGSAITVTSTINPWGGNATTAEHTYIGYVTPDKYDYEGISIGDVIYSDGSWSTAANRSVGDNASKKVMAIVFATENQIATAHKEAGYHGYAISVFDTPEEKLKWSTNPRYDNVVGITDVSWDYNDATGPAKAAAYFSNLNQPNHVNDGIYNTNEVLKLDLSKYPAFKAIDDFNKNPSTKITGLKWFMGSVGEWILCFENLANLSSYSFYSVSGGWNETWGDGIRDNKCWGPYWLTKTGDIDNVLNATNSYLSVAGTDGVDYLSLQMRHNYWTSTEYVSDGSAFRFDNNSGTAFIRSSVQKDGELYVRPFLAF